MLTLLSSDPVTSSEIIVAVCTVLTCAILVGGTIVAVAHYISGGMAEFRTGIAALTAALEKLSGSVDSGFTAVHDRLDRGEQSMHRLDRRLIRVEMKNGINTEMEAEHG